MPDKILPSKLALSPHPGAKTPIRMEARPMPAPSILNNVPETDTQPLWFRLVLPGATVLAANARTFVFNKQKNTDPDLTNLEVAGQMPNTSEYRVSAIELRPNANCTSPALDAFLANHRLKIEVGAKNFEKVNQPCGLFPSMAQVAGLNGQASIQHGLYRFNPGEELYLQASQTFNVYFEADRDGATLGAAADLLDLLVVFWGQKSAKVAL
ncbi:MAG TPA: hypothetical protein VFT46_06250 [Holophagaceae bacterium]|nr:hypothetical protein [Holophagaceae bacterium]